MRHMDGSWQTRDSYQMITLTPATAAATAVAPHKKFTIQYVEYAEFLPGGNVKIRISETLLEDTITVSIQENNNNCYSF